MSDECPNCGAELPAGARSCPECGSDEQTGWSQAAANDGLDLPDDAFDYDDFVKREFGPKPATGRRLHWLWWLAAVLLLAALMTAWLKS